MIGISACLGGIACRYDGKSQTNDQLVKLVQENKAIIVCPEVLGGLSTPRKPAEIIGGDGYDVLQGNAKVIDIDGIDVTDAFLEGARRAFNTLRDKNITIMILKENSPSCGSAQIYDGTFCSPALAGDKTAYALLSGAGGVMVFRVGCNRLIDDQNSVTGGIEDTLNRYVTGW